MLCIKGLTEAQNRVSEAEKRLWVQRGAIRTSHPHPGLWRGFRGHFVLPLSLLPIAIKKMHEPDHCSRAQVIRKLQAVWWSPYMTPMVDRELSLCPHCPKYNIRKMFSQPLAHIPMPDGPFRHLVMDYVDMIDRVQGKRYMFVVVCRFSRWIEACPTSKADHKAAAKFLCKEVFLRFGMPDTISSDNGPHFVSQVIQEMFKILGIKQKYGCVYHPQSQGSVEQANGVLKTKIAKIMADCNGKLTWVDALPIALMAMRSQTNRLTHLTPHEMLTGRPMPLPQTRGPVEGPAIAQLERELGDYLHALTQIHRLVFQQVKEAHGKDETHIPVDVHDVQVGDSVFIRVFRRQWNEPRRERPFKVVLTTPTALKVEGKPFWFHKNHCTRHRPPDRPGHYPGPSESEHADRETYGHPLATSPRSSSSSTSSQSRSSHGERRSARLAARRLRRSQSTDSEYLDTPTPSPGSNEPPVAAGAKPPADTDDSTNETQPADGPPTTDADHQQHGSDGDGSPDDTLGTSGSPGPQAFTYPPTLGGDGFLSGGGGGLASL
ncbi:uncharacterized protein K02A2.6-like isoform X2 [Takifugu flavidus]|uniref:uncharacterized protein K02A2.6-like isoform X2 n=1 Tax=Takifugu flavidus TaxID=433684 RepID=UPI0025448E4C|nr:uncharacterized protein K02A2.6-like isoform X2 [Takifugu flavidus]